MAKNIKTDKAQSFDREISKIYTTTAKLRLRTGADFSKQIITIIPKGDNVFCFGRYTGDWYYVRYNNQFGYCLKTYLQ